MTWGYGRDDGPHRWGELAPEFEMCGLGTAQSPIDLSRPETGGAEPVEVDYRPLDVEIGDAGHTVMATCPPGAGMVVDGERFELVQFHLHTPSEHTMGGAFFDAEIHLVHESPGGSAAVLGVFISAGARTTAYDPIWDAMPAARGDAAVSGVTVDVEGLLPADRRHFRYEGSLTTPPCTEGVLWAVMRTPVEASPGQLARFAALHRGSNRPVQPRNGRRIRLVG